MAVISPSEKPRQVIDKARMYLNNGGKLVWTVYPEDKVVDVYRLNAQNSLLIDSLGDNDTLDGSDVLPGFTLPMKDIFVL